MCRHRERQPGRRNLKRHDTSRLLPYRPMHMLVFVMGAVTRELLGLACPMPKWDRRSFRYAILSAAEGIS